MGENPANNEDPQTVQDIFEALDDSDCRAILRETVEPMTAKELSDTCEIPNSTMYRKLDLLSSASLVRERIKVNPDGGRITRYQRDFDDITVTMEDDQFSVTISQPERPIDERLAEMWSEMGDEI